MASSRLLRVPASGAAHAEMPGFKVRRMCCEIGDLNLEQFNQMRRIALESFEFVPPGGAIPLQAPEFEEKRFMHARYGCGYRDNSEIFVTHVIETAYGNEIAAYGRDKHKRTSTDAKAMLWKGAVDARYRGIGLYSTLVKARLSHAIESGFTRIASYLVHPNVAPAMAKALQELRDEGVISGYSGSIYSDSDMVTVDLGSAIETSVRLRALLRGRAYSADMQDPEVQAEARRLKGALTLRIL